MINFKGFNRWRYNLCWMEIRKKLNQYKITKKIIIKRGCMMAILYKISILSLLLPMTISAQCVLTPDNENVVGTQLAGDWEINKDLTAQLWPDYTVEMGATTMSFTDNPSIMDMLPEEECAAWLENYGQLFLAGELNITTTGSSIILPYVLGSLRGVPHVMTPDLGINVMLARAGDRDQDLLFIGGEVNNQPFTAWTRI